MPKTQPATAKLSDAQLVILSAAAQRADGSLLPLPESLAVKGAALNRVMIETLCKRKLAEERRTINGAPEWRRDEEHRPLGLFITKSGLLALGIDETEKPKPAQAAASMPRQRKTAAAKPRGKARKASAAKRQEASSVFAKQAGCGDPDAAAAIRRHHRGHHRQDRVGSRIRCAASSAVSSRRSSSSPSPPRWARTACAATTSRRSHPPRLKAMARSLTPRPRRLRRRGRSSAQSEQDLRTSVAARVLALPNCARGELEEQWRAVWGTEPPRHGSREFLIRAVAYGIQAQAFGGLDAKTLQLLRKANGANGRETEAPGKPAQQRLEALPGMARRNPRGAGARQGLCLARRNLSELERHRPRHHRGALERLGLLWPEAPDKGGAGQWLRRRRESEAPALRHLYPQIL